MSQEVLSGRVQTDRAERDLDRLAGDRTRDHQRPLRAHITSGASNAPMFVLIRREQRWRPSIAWRQATAAE
ncbi:unnamed protein product, partial [Nippostrongylus brasiliensis]|uniref:Transcriptional regulator n=1 Tax=Nippostrongylus brasiliensis TaxID=27835 RepID=A0A0N4XPB0_NIPBR